MPDQVGAVFGPIIDRVMLGPRDVQLVGLLAD